MKSPAELAHKIETGIETPSGRYDWASKVEVRAYVQREIAKLVRDSANILALQARIAELELTKWQRVKRALRRLKVRT